MFATASFHNVRPSRRRLAARFSHAGAARRHDPEALPAPRAGKNWLRARKNRRMGRSPFPHAPLFFPAPSLFIPSFCAAALLLLDIARLRHRWNALLGAARLGSSDGGTPPVDHRFGPTSWRKASAHQSDCLCKPTTRDKLGERSRPRPKPRRFGDPHPIRSDSGVAQRRAACPKRPVSRPDPTTLGRAAGRRLEPRRRRRGIRRGKERKERKERKKKKCRSAKPPKPIRADKNGKVGLTLTARLRTISQTFACGRWMRETDNMRAFRLSARRRKSYTSFSAFITISAQRGKANPKRLVPARQGLALAATPRPAPPRAFEAQTPGAVARFASAATLPQSPDAFLSPLDDAPHNRLDRRDAT